MTPTEQDKELREKLDIRDRLKSLNIFRLGFGFDTYELIDFILADRKRVALEARIDEMKLHRHEWALFGDGVSLPILLAYHDDRIAELKAQQEEK